MTRAAPLVYVDRAVREQADRIVGRCPENEIEAAILRGRVQFANGRALIGGNGWEAVAVRRPGRLRPAPRCWNVIAITRTTTKGQR